MRIGRGIHPEGMPGWCQGFSLDGGSGVRALKVIQQGNRPGLIYNIGIDVKKGRGRYIDTCMVIFAPRYLLDNKSSHKLAFAQREFARGQGTANPEGYISTLPGSSVVFHWPRNDYDQLLCVRLMDVPNCIWSGGFEVNKNNSFHINMRDTLGKCASSCAWKLLSEEPPIGSHSVTRTSYPLLSELTTFLRFLLSLLSTV